MAVDWEERMPVPKPRNLSRLANTAKELDAGSSLARSRLDDGGFLLGRVICIRLDLEVVVDKVKEKKAGDANGRGRGASQTRKFSGKRWKYSCTNRKGLLSEASEACKNLKGPLSESAANKHLRDQSAGVLQSLGLGKDFAVFFAEDLVLLEGYADHYENGDCPGLPLAFRMFLGRFRRHLLPIEQFLPLFEAIGSDSSRVVASPLVDYHELFFPPETVVIAEPTPTADVAAAAGAVQQPARLLARCEVDREVVVCLNTGEPSTRLGSDALLPCSRAPARWQALEGKVGYGGLIAQVEKGYADCHRKCVSPERLARMRDQHRVICVFRKQRP